MSPDHRKMLNELLANDSARSDEYDPRLDKMTSAEVGFVESLVARQPDFLSVAHVHILEEIWAKVFR